MRIPGKLFWTSLPLIAGLVVPSLILIAVETIAGRIPFGAALTDVWSQQFADGENVFLLSAIGLIPFALLSIFSFFAARWLSPRRLACVALGGLLGILLYMVPAHATIWYPLCAGGHISSTAAITFLFIPFYCVPALAVGLLVGWIV
ncbi:MAG TPA: hypothetical protein VFO30_08760, partial [Chthoniobacterales bacterium]|nr:hypothetical protein [Chthoniobacterales bacterium]